MADAYPFLKGHGTENDFVLLPDHDGTVHGELTAERVVALCDRRAGIGGDGVIRVVRSAALGAETDAEWFMDYRNSDGSVSEMCGNGIRVFGRHLADEGLVDTGGPVPVGTRDGIKTLTFEDDGTITADMGSPRLLGESKVAVGDRSWPATHVDMGNPHAVAFVDSLDDAGSLLSEPAYDAGTYPHGVNIEFVTRRGPGHVAFRVHERGSGGDPVLRHRCLRGDGRRRGRRRGGRPAGRGPRLPRRRTRRHPDGHLDRHRPGPAQRPGRAGGPGYDRPVGRPSIGSMDITGASALVTGGASGIGAAVVRQLAAQGAKVVVADLQEERGQALADEVGGVFAKVDVTDTAQIQAAVVQAAELGDFRILVNSAGIGWAQRTIGRDGEFDSAHDLDGVLQGDRDQPDRHLRRDPARRDCDVAQRARRRVASAGWSSTWPAWPRSTARSARRRTPRPRAAWSA